MPRYPQMLQAGMTPRQVDYWTRNGWLRLATESVGTGVPREWRPGEDTVGRMMQRLIAAGLTAPAAHAVARAGGDHDLADGVRVVVTPPRRAEQTLIDQIHRHAAELAEQTDTPVALLTNDGDPVPWRRTHCRCTVEPCIEDDTDPT